MADEKDADDPNVEEKSDSRKGLSQGAWVAIGTIGAALVTASVALVTHLLPPTSSTPAPTPTPTAVLSTPSPSPSPSPGFPATTADRIAGKWAGMAKNRDGTAFQITLEVRRFCAINERCGVISVSHVPCEGEVFLEKVEGDLFEFHVDNFYGRSNRAVCQPGAGELFTLRSDGKLAYTTSYEAGTQGVLERID